MPGTWPPWILLYAAWRAAVTASAGHVLPRDAILRQNVPGTAAALMSLRLLD